MQLGIIKVLGLAVILLMPLTIGPVIAQEYVIRFVGGKSLESPSTQFLLKLYSEAFKRIGYQFSYEEMPNNRASILSDEGKKYAGELSRVSNYDSKHPQMKKLEMPHYSVEFLAISAKYPRFKLAGWDSLTGKNLKIVYRRGTKIIEDNLPQRVSDKNIIAISETEQGLKLVETGRVDLFLEGSVNVARFFETTHYKASDLYFAGVMQKLDIHMFIHENYRAVIPKLNAVLKDMKEEGLFEVFRTETSFEELQMR